MRTLFLMLLSCLTIREISIKTIQIDRITLFSVPIIKAPPTTTNVKGLAQYSKDNA